MIHLYTGKGKGKTTAAFGLCLRASGHNMKSLVIQFIKGLETGERKALADNPLIKVFNYGSEEYITSEPKPSHFQSAKDALYKLKQELETSDFDIIVLDEINTALYFNLLSKEELNDSLSIVREHQELILTGRNAPNWIIDKADLVTEFKEIKHYYNNGTPARKGIEF